MSIWSRFKQVFRCLCSNEQLPLPPQPDRQDKELEEILRNMEELQHVAERMKSNPGETIEAQYDVDKNGCV
jgi:hypothetical protein